MSGFGRSAFTLTAGAFFIILGLVIILANDLPMLGWRLTLGIVSVALGIGTVVFHLREKYGSDADPATVDETVIPDINMAGQIWNHSEEVPESVAAFKALNGKFRIAGQEISAIKVEAFGKFLGESRRYRGRIFEKITPSSRQVQQLISTSLLLDFAIPASPVPSSGPHEPQVESLFYPAVTVRKGELQDGFRLELEGGAPVLVLTYEEYCQLMVVMVRTLFRAAGVEPNRQQFASRLMDQAMFLICRRQLISDNYSGAKDAVKQVRTKLNDLADEIERDCPPPTGDAEVDQAAMKSVEARANRLRQVGNYVASFHDRYPIVTVIPSEAIANNRAVVKYRRVLTPAWCHKSFAAHPISFVRERAAAFFGSGVGDVDIDLRRASRAQSYHIEVYGVESSYVGAHRVTGLSNYEMVGHDASKRHVRFGRLRGQSYTHWYFRDLARKRRSGSDLELAAARDADDELTLHVSFYETPPSSLAKASISSLASFILIFVVALLASISPSGLDLQSDFPALVLAFPAVAAAWIGMDRGSGVLLVGEVGSRFSSFITLLLSLFSTALFMAQNSSLAKLQQLEVAILGIRDPLWLTLALVALASTLLTFSA